jgi:hypothetical protein
VIFYEHVDYGGAAGAVLAKGNYSRAQLQAAGVPDNWASSVRVPAGWTVTVYAEDNFGGQSWVRTADTPNFVALTPNANDQLTSCRIS